jgi:hypothetical protein
LGGFKAYHILIFLILIDKLGRNQYLVYHKTKERRDQKIFIGSLSNPVDFHSFRRILTSTLQIRIMSPTEMAADRNPFVFLISAK